MKLHKKNNRKKWKYISKLMLYNIYISYLHYIRCYYIDYCEQLYNIKLI
jgi:hypothetical protein